MFFCAGKMPSSLLLIIRGKNSCKKPLICFIAGCAHKTRFKPAITES